MCFAGTLKERPKVDPMQVRQGRLLAALPEEFTNEKAYAEAERLGLEVSKRQIRRDLEGAQQRGLVVAGKRSQWKKQGALAKVKAAVGS